MPAAAAKGDPRRGRKASSRHVSRPWDNLARGPPSVRPGAMLQQSRGGNDRQRDVIAGRPLLRPVQETAAPGERLPHERFTPLLRTAYGGQARHEHEDYRNEELEDDGANGQVAYDDESSSGSDEQEDSTDDEDTDDEQDYDGPGMDNSDAYEELDADAVVRRYYGNISNSDYHRDNQEALERPAQGNQRASAGSAAQEVLRTSAIENLAWTRQNVYENPDKIRLGHRSIKPLNVRALPPPPLAGLLPIPNLPQTPVTTAYRHSIMPPPASHDTKNSRLADGDKYQNRDHNEGDWNVDANGARDCENSARYSGPGYSREHENQPPCFHITSMDSPPSSISLDGFGRSARRSIRRHSSIENPALRHSQRGPSLYGSSNDDGHCSERRNETSTSALPAPHAAIQAGYASLQDFVDFDNDSWAARRNIIPGSDNDVELERHSADFSDVNSTSTFASDVSSPKVNEHGTPARNRDPVAHSNEANPRFASESFPTQLDPAFPGNTPPRRRNDVSSKKTIDLKSRRMNDDDDDDDVFDAPAGIVASPVLEPAMRDLQRASVKAGHELAAVAFGASTEDASPAERVSRAQGELLLRSRFLRRWNPRFASVVDHVYFGAVLFLFCMDAKAAKPGGLVLKNSKMIVLADALVQKVGGHRKHSVSYLIELKTAQRSYLFACDSERQRKYWLKNFTTGTT